MDSFQRLIPATDSTMRTKNPMSVANQLGGNTSYSQKSLDHEVCAIHFVVCGVQFKVFCHLYSRQYSQCTRNIVECKVFRVQCALCSVGECYAFKVGHCYVEMFWTPSTERRNTRAATMDMERQHRHATILGLRRPYKIN